MEDETWFPPIEMNEICKDFAIIHADAERALNLIKGLKQKIDKAIAENPPDPGDGDEFYQLYEFRKDCLNCVTSLVRLFSYKFGQDILKCADKAIVEEWEKEKACEQKFPISTKEELTEMVDAHIKETVQELAKALGVEERVSRENCFLIISELKGIAQYQKLEKERRNRFLNLAFSKMQLIVVPLLRMALATDSIDEDGNPNEDQEILIQAALEILTEALGLTRGFEE